jgi:hypothetical protein
MNTAVAEKVDVQVGPKPMTKNQVKIVLRRVRQASIPGTVEDGTRIHVHYKSFGKTSQAAIDQAKRAQELGLPSDRYTGRISRIWTSNAGDLLVNVYVELERDHQYRTFNMDKGTVYKLVVLGE